VIAIVISGLVVIVTNQAVPFWGTPIALLVFAVEPGASGRSVSVVIGSADGVESIGLG